MNAFLCFVMFRKFRGSVIRLAICQPRGTLQAFSPVI